MADGRALRLTPVPLFGQLPARITKYIMTLHNTCASRPVHLAVEPKPDQVLRASFLVHFEVGPAVRAGGSTFRPGWHRARRIGSRALLQKITGIVENQMPAVAATNIQELIPDVVP